jgi:hypothetical protein
MARTQSFHLEHTPTFSFLRPYPVMHGFDPHIPAARTGFKLGKRGPTIVGLRA